MMLNSWYCDCYLTDDDRRKYKQNRGKRAKVLMIEEDVIDTEVVKEVCTAFTWEEQQRKCFDTSWVDSILFSSEAKG